VQLTYDLDAGALYIEFREGTSARTREVDGNTFVDLDDSGHVLGVEVISFAHPWAIDRVLEEFELPASEVAQLRAYFGSRVAAPNVSTGSPPVIPVLVAV
jgi:uncharacterized protein YuzE